MTGAEEVKVAAGTFQAWKVELTSAEGEPGATTLWIDKATRKVVKTSTDAAADGRRRRHVRAPAVEPVVQGAATGRIPWPSGPGAGGLGIVPPEVPVTHATRLRPRPLPRRGRPGRFLRPGLPAEPAKEPSFESRMEGMRFRCIGPFRGGRVTAVAGVRGQRERPLLRRHRRRRLEDDRRRGELGAGLRQGLQDRLRRRGRRRRVGPERRLGRDGRGADPRERLARRRRLALDRRGAELEAPRPAGHAADLGAAGPPEGPRRGVGRRAGKGLGAERGARDLPDEGRREDAGRASSSSTPRTGASDLALDPSNPRILYAGFWQVVRRPWELVSGGPGSSLCRSDRRRRHLDEADEGAPGGDLGKGRRRRLRREARDASGRSSRPRRGASSAPTTTGESLDEGERGERPAPAGLVLHGGLRRPEERRHGLGHERPALEVGRRREELHLDPDAPRRQPRPLDRPRRPGPPDRGERRRRVRDVRRREDLVVDRQPADGPVLPGRRRRPLPVPRLRRAAGQHDRRHREPGPRAGDRPRGVARRRRLRERLDRPEAGRAGRRLRRLLRRVDHPVRPPDRRGARDHRLAAARHRPPGERPEVPHPVERADPRLAARPERPLARGAAPPRVDATRGRAGRRSPPT